MHELFLIKVSETLTAKALMHPVTIMTRAPVAITNSALLCISLNLSQIFVIATF
jgi:hypothetical protein